MKSAGFVKLVVVLMVLFALFNILPSFIGITIILVMAALLVKNVVVARKARKKQ